MAFFISGSPQLFSLGNISTFFINKYQIYFKWLVLSQSYTPLAFFNVKARKIISMLWSEKKWKLKNYNIFMLCVCFREFHLALFLWFMLIGSFGYSDVTSIRLYGRIRYLCDLVSNFYWAYIDKEPLKNLTLYL